jgi:hypothetical protein
VGTKRDCGKRDRAGFFDIDLSHTALFSPAEVERVEVFVHKAGYLPEAPPPRPACRATGRSLDRPVCWTPDWQEPQAKSPPVKSLASIFIT